MKRIISVSVLSAASVVACAGLATSARANVTVAPPSVYFWTGHDYGAGPGIAPGALPYIGASGSTGAPTWTWQPNSQNQPVIDPNGRIYFTGVFRSTPQPAAVTSTTNIFGIFSASAGINNSPDLNLVGQWATGQVSPNSGMKITNNAGTLQGMANTSQMRISGTNLAWGIQIGNPLGSGAGINESTTLTPNPVVQNNRELYVGDVGTQNFVVRQGRQLTVYTNNDWLLPGSTTAVHNDITDYRANIVSQAGAMNTSGTMFLPIAFSTTATTAGATPALAATTGTTSVSSTTGNASALATLDQFGTTTIIARVGDLPRISGATDARVIAGGASNGVGGNFAKISRDGHLAYDTAFLNRSTLISGSTFNPGPGGVTTANDAAAWIYTPGSGTAASQNTRVYQEGNNVMTHTDPISGLQTSAGSAIWTGQVGIASNAGGFSNAGLLWTATPSGGDTVTTGGGAAGQNNQFLCLSTAAGGMTPVWKQRMNDIAPGFTLASNVHMGFIGGASSQLIINNSGTIAFPAFLQSSDVNAVRPNVSVVFDATIGGTGLISQSGIQGNDAALFVGNPSITGPAGLHCVARTGDVAPGTGAFFKVEAGGGSTNTTLNNNGDYVFTTGLTGYAGGTVIGVVGQHISTVLGADNRVVLWAYNANTYGLVPLLITGQGIEVETGVTRYIASFSGVNRTDNGDGGAANLNDLGQLTLSLRLSDTAEGAAAGLATSTSFIVLQVPAAGTGSLGLLGLAAMARRRRR